MQKSVSALALCFISAVGRNHCIHVQFEETFRSKRLFTSLLVDGHIWHDDTYSDKDQGVRRVLTIFALFSLLFMIVISGQKR